MTSIAPPGNPAIVYPMMARVGASMLADLAEQRLGARLGITMVLHTWSSDLGLHPHWHALVTGGGLSLDGERWVETRTDFLFPVAAIAKMYRGRLLEALIDALRGGQLDLDGIDDLDRTLRLVAKRHCKWGVHVEAPGDRPVHHVLKYLARCVHRVAISDHRMVGVTETHVGFRARHAASDGKQRVLWLTGAEFVRRGPPGPDVPEARGGDAPAVLARGVVAVRRWGLGPQPGSARLRTGPVPRGASMGAQGARA